MVEDAQTHRLPADRDGIAAARGLSRLPGSRPVRRPICAPISPRSRSTTPSCSRRRRACPGPATWSSPAPKTIPDTLATLARLGFADPARVAAMVRDWHHGRMRATRSQRAREILTEFVPELLRIFGATAHPDAALPALRPVPVASAGGGAAVFAVSRQSRPVLAGRRHHGRGAASGGTAWRSVRPCSMRC